MSAPTTWFHASTPDDQLQRRMKSAASQHLWEQNPVFAAAGAEACRQLAGKYDVRRREAGYCLYNAGDSLAGCTVLFEGTVRVYHQLPDGRQLTVKLLRAPMMLADVEVLQNLDAFSSVEAIEEIAYAEIPTKDYLHFVDTHPRAARAHLSHLAALSYTVANSERQRFAPIEQRLSVLLLSYASYFGCHEGDEQRRVRLACALSQQDMAQSLAANRRTIALVISDWAEKGLIAREGKSYVILDYRQLEELAGPIGQGLCYHMGMELDPIDPGGLTREGFVSVVDDKGGVVGRHAIEGSVRVGSSRECELTLSDQAVAPRHCRVFRGSTGGRFWIEDFGSSGGTFLNDSQIRRAVLRHDDTIRVGGTKLKFALESRA